MSFPICCTDIGQGKRPNNRDALENTVSLLVEIGGLDPVVAPNPRRRPEFKSPQRIEYHKPE